MMSGVASVIVFLALGYVLFIVEAIVPGGILGVLGAISVLYGTYLAFQLGPLWGSVSIVASVLFLALAARWLFTSKAGRSLTLSGNDEERSWKSVDQSWQKLVGKRGTAATDLRPAGVAMIDGVRVDVVADAEYLSVGADLTVVDVEGRRILVAAIEQPAAAGEAVPSDLEAPSSEINLQT